MSENDQTFDPNILTGIGHCDQRNDCYEQLSLKAQPVLSIMYKSLRTCLILVNLISIKVPDTQIYLITTNRGFLNEYVTRSKVCVHDGQNRLSFQRQLFTADRSRYVVNDFCSRQMKS